MAVDQDLLDRIASTIADLYREVEGALVKTVAQRLKKDLREDEPSASTVFYSEKLDAVRQLQASARQILATLQATRARLIREAVARAYRSGGDAAVADLPAEWFPKSGVGQAARRATQVIPNARVIENIAQALHRDVGRFDQNILRAPLDAYRAVQAGAAARITSGAFTRREASQAAWQRLMDKGIVDFTDKAGRTWRLSSYVEMLARTNAQRAAVQGQTDRLESIGIDLVYISDNVQECKVCRPFESKVLARGSGPVGKVQVEHATRDGEMVTVDVVDTLRGAMGKGLFHPNCRHSASAYLPGVTTLKTSTADPEGNKARQKQRALERKIRAAKEQQLGALDEAAKKDADRQVAAATAALVAHLKANPKLKRLRYREQIGAGNIPTASGPNGGAVTPLAPAVQDELPLGAPEAGASPARPAPAPAPVRPTPMPIPKSARKHHRNLDGIEQLVKAVEDGQPPADTRRLGGSSAETELVTLKDGTRVIRKRQRAGLADAQDMAAEQLASRVGQALGLRAPAVYRRDAASMWMEYIPDAQTADEASRWGEALPARFADAVTSRDGLLLGLLDLLTHNVDRNDGNWMLTSAGDLVPIDHGMAYGDYIVPGRPASMEFVDSAFTAAYRNRDGSPRPNPLTTEDVAEVRQRLENLRPDFEHVGRGHWLDYALRVLAMLAEHASGSENLIAGVR